MSALAPPRVAALELAGISKRFGATRALEHVDLRLEQGETLGLLGQNGSGKSTLVSILAGYHAPERGGEIRVAGRPVSLPVQRAQHGLSFVFQDLGLASGLTVLENLTMWKRSATGDTAGRWRIRWRAEAREAEQTLGRYGLDIPVGRKVASLSLLDQAMLAIARSAEELRRFRTSAGSGAGGGVLVLDEPTVFLPTREKSFLFDLIRRVGAEGSSIVFVSHDLAAIREVAQRVVVLRDGRMVGEASIEQATDERLAQLILGLPGAGSAPVDAPGPAGGETVGDGLPAGHATPAPPGPVHGAPPVLVARDLAGGRVTGVDLDVAPGEIVGVAGLIGSGVEDLPYLLFGALAGGSGELVVNGTVRSVDGLDPSGAIRLGVALVPADRKADGIAERLTIWENGQLLVLPRARRAGVLRRSSLVGAGARQCDDFDIRPRDPRARAGALSGGNQQKVLLAKWLEIDPAVLVVHEPTQGVDVGARAEIVELIRRRTAEGMGVVWVTSDFEELAQVCDRVLVMKAGVVDEVLHAGGRDAEAGRLTKEMIDLAVLSFGREPTPGGSVGEPPAGATR